MKLPITILLGIYNGEKYLSQQLDSLINQTVQPQKILIFDDGSTDSSKEIIDFYCCKYLNIKLLSPPHSED